MNKVFCRLTLGLQFLFMSTLCADAHYFAGYSSGHYINLKEEYGEFGLYFPRQISDTMCVFADMRAYVFEKTPPGGSAGFGVRVKNGERISGMNLFYDYRPGKMHKGFHRIGTGIELLHPSFELYVNGYFPIGPQIRRGKKVFFNDFIGDFFATCRPVDFSVGYGVDAELGKTFYRSGDLKFYAGIGPYYYTSKRKKSFSGGAVRVELQFNRYLSLRVLSSYDKPNRSQTQATVYFSLPLWKSECQPPRRNGIIFLDHCCNFTWNWE